MLSHNIHKNIILYIIPQKIRRAVVTYWALENVHLNIFIYGKKHPWYELVVGRTGNGMKHSGKNLHWDGMTINLYKVCMIF